MNTELEQKAINRWLSMKAKCNKQKMEFNLSVADIRKLIIKKKCQYTGRKIAYAVQNGHFSIDRVDSSKGYIKGNVVACHGYVNKLKQNLTKQEIQSIVDKM